MKKILYPFIWATVFGLFWTGLVAFAAWGFDPGAWDSVGRFAYAVILCGSVSAGIVVGVDAAND